MGARVCWCRTPTGGGRDVCRRRRSRAPAAWAVVLAAALAQAAVADEAAAQPEPEPAADETAATPEPAEPPDDALDLEAILSNPLDDEAYRERRSCLHLRAVDRVEILDDTMVLFHVRRDKAWLNQLSSRCLGLHDDMIVALNSHGGSICRLDVLRGVSRGAGPFGMDAHCRLGDFEFIDPTQIEALRDALAERRKAADLARKTRRAARKARRAARRGE